MKAIFSGLDGEESDLSYKLCIEKLEYSIRTCGNLEICWASGMLLSVSCFTRTETWLIGFLDDVLLAITNWFEDVF